MKNAYTYCMAILQWAALLYGSSAFALENIPRMQSLFADAVVMARAFPKGGLLGVDAGDVQVMQARDLAAKTLGEDAKDLVFIPVAPCTVWDTRFATSAPFMGAIGDNVTRQFYSHLDAAGGDFTAYGGNPACTETNQTFLGGRPYAAMMTVYVNNPAGNGWLTFYRDGDPDPSGATISVYYSPGPTRTQTVISKSNRGFSTGAYDIAVTGRFSTADASASVVGYFIKPVNITLPNSTATTGNILKGANRFIHNYGAGNTFIGENAGNFTMTGTYNTASGAGVLGANTIGNRNTASGNLALTSNTTGYYNTASGTGALYYNTTGFNNTASGGYALQNNMNGNYNIAVGYSAGINLTTGSYNIDIGNAGVVAEGNTIRIGDSNQMRTYIAAIRGVTTGVANAIPVLIDSAGQLGTASSSRRFKDDIADMSEASSALMKLRPVTFHYKSDQNPKGRTLQYGLIAEEVADVYPGLVAHSADGKIETVMYQFLPAMLLNEVQKQQRTIETQALEIVALKEQAVEVAALKQQAAKVAALEEKVAKVAALEQLTAKMAATLDRLQRSGMITARLEPK